MRAISMFALTWALLTGCDPAPSAAGVWCQFPADCRRPNECSYHRCRPPCTSPSDCPTTHLCLAGHCAVVQDEGCATFAGLCASPLTCGEDHCTLRCTGICQNGALCRPARGASYSICVDPDETPVPNDAGGADGA